MSDEGSLDDLLRASAAATPDAIALRTGDDEVTEGMSSFWRRCETYFVPQRRQNSPRDDGVLPALPRTGTGKLDRHKLETRIVDDLK